MPLRVSDHAVLRYLERFHGVDVERARAELHAFAAPIHAVGAAHLAGVLAAKSELPVLAVPMPSKHLQGLDSLLAMVQMPGGIPVATFAIGEAGAVNAALFTVAMLALNDAELARKLSDFRANQTEKVLAKTLTDLP